MTDLTPEQFARLERERDVERGIRKDIALQKYQRRFARHKPAPKVAKRKAEPEYELPETLANGRVEVRLDISKLVGRPMRPIRVPEVRVGPRPDQPKGPCAGAQEIERRKRRGW